MVLFERSLILVAFQIRTLIDRPSKVKDDFKRLTLRCHRYPKIGERPTTRLNFIDFWELFDMEAGRPVDVPIRRICNQLIHHYLLGATSEGTEFASLLVFSDYERNRFLYEVSIPRLIDLFSRFASDDSWPAGGSLTWDEDEQDYRYGDH